MSQKVKNFKRLKAKLIVISSIYGKCCCEQIWKTSVLRLTLNTTNSTDGTNFAKWDSTMTLIPTVSTFKKSTRRNDTNICGICKIKRTKCGRFVILISQPLKYLTLWTIGYELDLKNFQTLITFLTPKNFNA